MTPGVLLRITPYWFNRSWDEGTSINKKSSERLKCLKCRPCIVVVEKDKVGKIFNEKMLNELREL